MVLQPTVMGIADDSSGRFGRFYGQPRAVDWWRVVMRLVLLYGPPGVGKLTIGRQLAEMTGFKLFHNHLTVNAVEAVFPRGTDSWQRLIRAMRCLMVAEAARAGVDVVMTFALGAGEGAARAYVEAAESNGGRVHLVRLTCADEVLLTRVGAAERAALGKLTDPARLRELLDSSHRPRELGFGESLTIDTTDTAPAEAARRIVEHYGLPVRTPG
jgi:chloramphenicol 3-O-phosphotransferase